MSTARGRRDRKVSCGQPLIDVATSAAGLKYSR
jgi:hypothetical protein